MTSQTRPMAMAFALKSMQQARENGTLEREARRLDRMRENIRIPYHVQNMSLKILADADLRADYFHVRFGGAPKAETLDEFNKLAGDLALRIELPEWIPNRFYGLRPRHDISIEEWCAGARLAAAQEQLSRDLVHAGGSLFAFYHSETTNVLATINARSGPMVLLTTHFGPRFQRLLLSKECMPEIVVMTMQRDTPPYMWKNPEEAAFVAMKALLRGEKIFIAPDGPKGDKRVDIPVFDQVLDVAHGPFAMAYEARAHIGSLHVSVTPQGFLPVFVDPGIAPMKGERKEDFIARSLAFYSSTIEQSLSADPDQFLILPVMESRLRPKANAVMANSQ